MRSNLFPILALVSLAACGGGEAPKPAEPAPEAKTEEKAPEPPKAPEAPKEEAPDFATLSPDDAKAWLMKKGEEVYKTGGSSGVACLTCHQENGQGVPGAFPPLVGSGEFMGDCKKHAGIVLNGLSGEITVGGTTYNGVMPPVALSDVEVAAVITYERSSWGNDYGACLPADVAGVKQ